MYRIDLACADVPIQTGPAAAARIAEELPKRLPEFRNVSCTWDGSKLTLSAETDRDPYSESDATLTHAFAACLARYADWTGGGLVVSVHPEQHDV
jgi:hypothetical protein